MPDSPPQTNRQHLGYLDSARGIAALMVVFYHFINWRYPELLSVKLATFIFNGRDAVSFFFVLSGFVLSYKYIVLNVPLDIRKFFINRFLRLFPAFFVTLVIGTLYWQRQDLHAAKFYTTFISNKEQFWEEAYLFKPHNKFFVPDWTLVLELTISFFMPFAIVIAKANRKLLPWLLLTYLLISHVINPYFIHFALGLLITCYYFEVSDASFRQTKWYKYRVPLIISALVLYSVRVIDHIWSFGSAYTYLSNFFEVDFMLYSGIASFIFLAAMVHSRRLQRFLNIGILRFYGKISYGVYLTHWVVVTAIFDHWEKLLRLLFYNNVPVAFFSLLAICLAITTLLALLMHYVVELPFMRIGKRITTKLKPSVVIT